jgi:hypothetical protein
MKNYVRLTRFTLEKDAITQFSGSFGFTIPANLLFYYRKSMAEFIKNNGKSFFIDPMTYLFVYPTNMLKTRDFEPEVDSSGKYKLKKSFEKVICAYDKELLSLFQSCTSLPPSYFDASSNVEKFVQNNIRYQKNLLRESLDRVSQYESMLGLDGSKSPSLEPEFITAPYFYFTNTSDPWYSVNLSLSRLTKERCQDDKVYAVVCVNKQSLDTTLADSILTDLNVMDGIILFASDFNESAEPVPSLRQFRSFVSKLQESAKPVLNLYGSFFSILLRYDGLNGVSSGLCILDHRDASAEFKGARAPIRYYVPSLRDKLSEQDFKTFLLQFNTASECDCSFCQALAEARKSLSTREFVTQVDQLFKDGRGQLMIDVMGHFLHNRLRELEMVETKSASEIREIIETKKADSEKYRALINTGDFVDRILHSF